MVQPSKVLSLLPRPSGNQDQVLSHLGTTDEKRSHPVASEPGMNPLPLLVSVHVSSFRFISNTIALGRSIAVETLKIKTLSKLARKKFYHEVLFLIDIERLKVLELIYLFSCITECDDVQGHVTSTLQVKTLYLNKR